MLLSLTSIIIFRVELLLPRGLSAPVTKPPEGRGARIFSHVCFAFQEFAISKNIQLGDEKGLRFPSVWDWALQFTAKDRALFHNPFYIGKSTPCLQNGSRKSLKRSKVNCRQQPISSGDLMPTLVQYHVALDVVSLQVLETGPLPGDS